MALPPEQINIKRRREEEPVETLYIQSATHQSKRRFTDYVFERVTLSREDVVTKDPTQLPPGHPATQRALRTPRSVSSLHIPNRRAAAAAAAAAQPTNTSGIPVVRATSPGAEIREAQRLAAARREAEENRQRLLQTPPQPQSGAQSVSSQAPSTPSEQGHNKTGETLAVQGLSSRTQSLRRFQISRSSSPSLGAPGTLAGGIQKRRADGAAPGVAVLVEQLRRQPHSRKASMVAGLVDQARVESVINEEPDDAPVKPRKRPVVNQAEKRWREERQVAINAAKQHISEVLDKSARQTSHHTWEEESEHLAKDFEQVALELEQDRAREHDHEMEIDDHSINVASAQQSQARNVPMPLSPPKPMKYQPRPPKQPRAVPRHAPSVSNAEGEGVVAETATGVAGANSAVAEENEDDYVYDVYIRRPLSESEMLTNPLAEHECEQQLQQIEAANRGIGVIVITAEDEEYWEHFVEDEEEEWDSEDADSNAENNPANEYPDEELTSSDEDDDPTAIYRKSHYRAGSDDEEYDIDDSDSDGGARFGSGSKYGFSHRYAYAGDGDSDEDM
ncbi:hypothetical protein N7539_004414 [Penicillium diatomitis]|uniref:Transcription factor Iwr1 domain-containing protein n=1 Tax=Penicillium diatomitis TaxID=2819901 RepID=A0A9X0BYG6_9EURO|nr:uncharacterized protein N7539_004414 [Penicillium diatomitis]KAJ5489524.1 hypothetical protein N7539_004414 [Penicillium diatomitis]